MKFESNAKKFKQVQSELLKHLIHTMPMVEECHNSGQVPIAVISFSPTKDGQISTHIATRHDSHDKLVYDICKAFVEQCKYKYDSE